MKFVNIRVLTLFVFFVALLAFAGLGLYYLYVTLSTKAKPLTDSFVEVVPLPEKKYDYNFPAAEVAGVTETADYEYILFNIPIDYSTYLPGNSASSERFNERYNNSLPLSKLQKVEVPVLGFSQELQGAESIKSSDSFVGGMSTQMKVFGTSSQLFLGCNDCLPVRELTSGDVIVLESEKGSYYFKLVTNGEVINKGRVLPDNFARKNLLVLGPGKETNINGVTSDDVVIFELRAIP